MRELIAKRKDGSLVDTQISASLVTGDEGKPISRMASLVDIIDHRWAEEALRKAYDVLEQRAEERTAELERTNHELKQELEQRKRIETELLEKQAALRAQNISTVRKSIELSDIKRELEDKNYDLARSRADLEEAMEALRKARDELERRVEKRTAELSKANEKLRQEIKERKWAEDELLVYHQKLRFLSSELALAEERERRRIAVQVHDHIAQNLAFAKINLGTVGESTSSEATAETVGQVSKLIDETIHDIRSLISELASPVLYELGFVPAVEWLTQETQKRHGVMFAFEDDGQPKPLSHELSVLLFQAVRELLINVAKHAQARTARVSVTRNGEQIRVDVNDDGVGMDATKMFSSMNKAASFGFFSIQQRLQPLGGYLSVESEPSHGTRVTLLAPLKRKK